MSIERAYAFEFPYRRDFGGDPFPILPVQLQAAKRSVDTVAYLDSGAEYSLFQADLCRVLGVDVLGEPTREYGSTIGNTVIAAVRTIIVSHPNIGRFSLQMGFAIGVRRNLLGRDFFNEVQIGFRERYSMFYITPTP